MTYADLEASAAEGRPLFLYLFTEGAQTWRFTARASDWTTPPGAADASGTEQVWTALAIAHSDIVVSANAKRNELDVTLPLSDAFAQRFLAPRGARVTGLTIYRSHEQLADETAAVFKGRVLSVRRPGRRVVLRCESVFSTLRRAGVRRRYQRLCPHPLYAGLCRLDIAGFLVSATASAPAGLTLEVDAAGSADPGTYTGGVLRFGGIDADIAGHDGTTLTLAEPFPELLAEIAASGTAAVAIAPGCDRRVATCKTRFANLANFGGFPDMPQDNPLDGTALI